MAIKVAIAGAGYIASIHAHAIRQIEDIELVAVVEKYSEKAHQFAEAFNIQRIYEDVSTMIAKNDIDAIVIGTPNFLHAMQSLEAMNAGIHVMVEKPMAMNVKEAEEMLNTSQQTNTKLLVAHCWRFDKDVLWLKEKIQQSLIGRIIHTHGYGVHVNWGPQGWFTQKALAGGGALVDMGIHAIDTARFLLGDPLPVNVYAHIGTYYGNYDVDDTAELVIEWKNGTTSTVEAGWWQPHADGPEAGTRLYGDEGYASVFPTYIEQPNIKLQTVEKILSGLPYPRDEHCEQEMYNRQMAHFFECIREDKTPVPGGEEGLINMKILQAAYTSAVSGTVEPVK